MEPMIFYAIVMSIIGALSWLRKRQEEKAQQRRMDEPGTTVEDMPEATRRQLYGDAAQPIREARPAQRTAQASAPPAIPTARPRQQQKAPARRQATPAQAPARRQQSRPTPQRQAQRPTMQRLSSALEQMAESVQEQMNEMEGRPAAPPQPPPRRRQGKSPEQLAAEQQKRQQEASRKRSKVEAARAKRQREVQAAVARKPSGRLIGDSNELRRGIILAEVLGKPKGLEF
jgi:hypothetical protein